MFGFRKPIAPQASLGDLAAELEHICETTRAQLQVQERLLGALQQTRNQVELVNGRLERVELYLATHVPGYPETQLDVPCLPEVRERIAGGADGR